MMCWLRRIPKPDHAGRGEALDLVLTIAQFGQNFGALRAQFLGRQADARALSVIARGMGDEGDR